MRCRYLFILIIFFLLCSCDDSSYEQVTLPESTEWVTAKVAVVLPLSGEDNDKERYERISRMFEENIIKAQLNCSEAVKIELEWYDENTLDVLKFANELYYRNDIQALIGPLKDENVKTVANKWRPHCGSSGGPGPRCPRELRRWRDPRGSGRRCRQNR